MFLSLYTVESIVNAYFQTTQNYCFKSSWTEFIIVDQQSLSQPAGGDSTGCKKKCECMKCSHWIYDLS